MRNKRMFIIVIVLGLLAALTTTVYATTSYHPATPTIVGTWKIVMPKSEGNPDASENLQTFFADGNFVETTSLLGHGKEGPDHGVWIGAGNTYYWTAQLFLFDETTGDHTGTLKVRAAVKMEDADHFTGHAVGDLIDLAGKETKNIGKVPFDFTGTRMEVELPYPVGAPQTDAGQALSFIVTLSTAAGTYAIAGTTMSLHRMVNRKPNWTGEDVHWEFRIDGDQLTLDHQIWKRVG